ncbi:MAG: alpha/beta hydrolase [Candidatus Neomarinimicrobiota bacterium]
MIKQKLNANTLYRLSFMIIVIGLSGCAPLVNMFSFFPDTNHTISSQFLPVTIQKINIKTSDNVTLSCFYLKNNKSNRLLIYFHGNAGNIDQRLPELIDFRNLGVNVLGVGYRGYGQSTGEPTEAGIYKDGYTALKYAKDSLGFPSDSIFICGRSIGTTVAIEVSQKRQLAGIILITPLTSGKDIAKFRHLQLFSPLIGNQFDNTSKCTNIVSPVLILHGTADETVPFVMGQRIFNLIKNPKIFIQIENGHHNDLEKVDPKLYWDSINGFINKNANNTIQ